MDIYIKDLRTQAEAYDDKQLMAVADFAEACYDDNTIEELQDALNEPVDEKEAAEWGLS